MGTLITGLNYSASRDKEARLGSIPTAHSFLISQGFDKPIIENPDSVKENRIWDFEGYKGGKKYLLGVQEKPEMNQEKLRGKTFGWPTLDIEWRKQYRDKASKDSVDYHIVVSGDGLLIARVSHDIVRSCPTNKMSYKVCRVAGAGRGVDIFVPVPINKVLFFRKQNKTWVIDENNNKYDKEAKVPWDITNLDGQWPIEDWNVLFEKCELLAKERDVKFWRPRMIKGK